MKKVLLIILPPIIFCLVGILAINFIFWFTGTGLLGQAIAKFFAGLADISGVLFIIIIIVGVHTFISSLISWVILIPSLKQLNFRIKLKKVLLLSFLVVPIIMIVGLPALWLIYVLIVGNYF